MQTSKLSTGRWFIWVRLLLGLMASMGLTFFLLHPIGAVPAWLASRFRDLTFLLTMLFLLGEAFFFHRDDHLAWWLKRFVLGAVVAVLVAAVSFFLSYRMARMLGPPPEHQSEFYGFGLLFAGITWAVPVTLVSLALLALLRRRLERYPASRLEALTLAIAVFLIPIFLLWARIGGLTTVFHHAVHLAQGRDRFGNTALITAAERGDIRRMESLIQQGANVNDKNPLGLTALHRACDCGQKAAVEELLAHGADVNAKDIGLHTPLVHGVGSGQVEAEPEAMEISDYGGGRYAPKCRPVASLEIVRELIKAGADINARDHYQMTPLMHAVYAGSTEVVRELVKDGADVNAVSVGKQTALAYAGQRPGPAEIVNILRGAGEKQ